MAKKKKEKNRNFTLLAMLKRYGKTTKTMQDKKKKKKQKFWKKDLEE